MNQTVAFRERVLDLRAGTPRMSMRADGPHADTELNVTPPSMYAGAADHRHGPAPFSRVDEIDCRGGHAGVDVREG